MYKRQINNVTKNLTVTVTTKPVAQAKGTVGIVDENSDAQALGVAYQGDKPTLDEALAAFDDVRAKRALELLQELSKQRQILLFSCHNREKNLS